VTDDLTITKFAQHYRLEAAAVLVQIARDETAPANARAAAAEKILAYSDGRPGASKAITVADLDLMSDEQRNELLNALLTKYETEMPGQFKALMEEAYLSALKRLDAPKPKIGFRRGPPAAPLGPHVPLPRDTQSTASVVVSGEGSYHGSPEHNTSMYTPLNDAYGGGDVREVLERSGTEPPPEQLQYTAVSNLPTNRPPPDTPDSSTSLRNEVDSRAASRLRNVPNSNNVLPFGLKYENPILGNTPDSTPSSAGSRNSATLIPVNGIHPQVLERSSRPDPGMAMDITFRDYSPRRRW
jgi:uncharacterized protein (UPF0147 family)